MQWDIIAVEVVGPDRLQVRFADGTQGPVTVAPSFYRGVFAHLRDPARFREVSATQGFLTWPDDLDVAPDAMYEQIRSTGECRLQ